MRCLMISTEKLPVPPVRGGAIQTYIHAVAPRLAQHHKVGVVGVTDPELPERETRDGVIYWRVPGGPFPLYLKRVLTLLEPLRDRVDVVHVFNRPRLVLPVRKVLPGSRIILSLHNEVFRPEKIDPDEARAAIGEVERIVTVSDFIGRGVAALYPEAEPKVQTIYSGVDLDRFLPIWAPEARRIRQRLKAEHGLGRGPVLLYVGRISPKKGVDVLVRALGPVAERYPGAVLVLVGSKWYGEDRISDYVAYVRALAARAPVKVYSTGYVPADQVHEWFTTGDLFLCASQWEEPLARVHYEAMAAGLPIITTDRGGNPEVVQGQGNGVVVEDPANPRAFADAMLRLLGDDGLRYQMGRRGRQLAEERYSWDRVATDIRSVWERG